MILNKNDQQVISLLYFNPFTFVSCFAAVFTSQEEAELKQQDWAAHLHITCNHCSALKTSPQSHLLSDYPTFFHPPNSRTNINRTKTFRHPTADTYWILMEGGTYLGFLGYHWKGSKDHVSRSLWHLSGLKLVVPRCVSIHAHKYSFSLIKKREDTSRESFYSDSCVSQTHSEISVIIWGSPGWDPGNRFYMSVMYLKGPTGNTRMLHQCHIM